MDIAQTARAAFTPEVIPELSRILDELPKAVQGAAGASVPTVLLLIAGKASHPEGAEQVLSALDDPGPALLDHLAQHMRNGDVEEHASAGMRRLSRLLGRDAAEGLAYAVSRFSGLTLASARIVAGLAGMGAIEAIGRSITTRDVPTLSSLLAQHQLEFADAVPSGMYEYIEAAAALRVLTHQCDRAQASTGTDDDMQNESEIPRQENRHNEQYYSADHHEAPAPVAMAWALPALIVLAIGAAMLFTFYPTNAYNPVTVVRPVPRTSAPDGAQAQPAASRLPATDGGFGISNMAYVDNEPLRTGLTGAFGRLASTLGSVRDTQTAANASTELGLIAEDLRQAQPRIAALPADAQARLADEIQHALPGVRSVVNSAIGQPGGEAVRPMADRVIHELQEITRNRQS